MNESTGKNSSFLSLFKKFFKSTPFAMCIAALVTILFVCYVGFPTSISGDSMSPTLTNGQFALVNRLDKKINRNDVIALNNPSSDNYFPLVKRVIAIAGDTVQVINGTVYVNNEIREESYEKIEDAGKLSEPITLKEGEYVVLGDNRNNSNDSTEFGVVTTFDIIGTVYTKQHNK